MNVTIAESWKERLKDEFAQEYFTELAGKVREAYLSKTVYPPPKLIFNAFDHCSFDEVRVVILGQDPYINPGQAMGLSFSVPDGVTMPPSLRNMYKEIESDIGTPPPLSGNLERWAKQGVLLLNATLTVERGQSNSHQSWGWGTFTDAVIKKIADEKEGVVFMLWGSFARGKAALIDWEKHCILEAPHPSPFSADRGFFGCKHFSQCNEYLSSHGHEPISW